MAGPEALILAGPNGAGKTTASGTIVSPEMHFLNSDVITARLLGEGHRPAGMEVAAGRIVLAELDATTRAHVSFCIETNLAGRGLLRRVDDWRHEGYTVRLVFVALDSPELAIARVATRVRLGGHDVPEQTIRRRWRAGLRSLFDDYLDLVDTWAVYDNSAGTSLFVAKGTLEPRTSDVADEERWSRLRNLGLSERS
jgi:predicted ABC-type ATPase